MLYDRENDPNAARLVESLRYLGYGNYEALADIVDNSIDADASLIQIRIQQRDGAFRIVIADDGTGMDEPTLDQAMRLGSLTARELNSDLGKFGMGLVTASLSIARNCHVITRGPDGVLSSAWDVDLIKEENAFRKHFALASDEEVELLDSFIGSGATGTIVELTKCDNITNKNTTHFASNLMNHLGRVHRYFVEAGRVIRVNGEMVEPRDPLQLADEPEIVLDDVVAVSFDDEGERRSENVRVRIALVPEATASDAEMSRSLKNQGFYIMRNLREVMNAVTLDFFYKHNDFNRMRGEIFFPGTMDRVVGIEFTKRQVELEQGVNDQLASVLVPVCRSIKRREANKKRIESSGVQAQLHTQAAKAIAAKDKLLIKPKARIERRASPVARNGSFSEPKVSRERRNLTRTQAVLSALNCEIREERMGPNGQIYEADMEGRRIVIRYNVEHPFYQRFILDNLADGRLVTAADFLVYSMASAELKMLDEQDADVINNYKLVLSSNLRTLLH